MEIISRKQAKERGLVYYFTGKPCKHGHINKRQTNNGNCIECNVKQSVKFSKTDKGKEVSKKYFKSEKGKITKSISDKRYAQTDGGKVVRKRAIRKYEGTTKGKDALKKKQRNYYNTDNGRLNHMTRNLLKRVFNMQGINKSASLEKENILGYTGQQLKSHLESHFTDGMSWDNYGFGEGKWVIDHKYPVAQHIRDGETDPAVINALDNLQPMWFKENLEKSDKVY